MDTSKSGWTPYVYYTTLFNEVNLLGTRTFRKVGKSESETAVQGKELNTGLSSIYSD